jgi:phosphohistidine phosphatase
MAGSRLILLRHAKSSWDSPAMADFDRPLNNRGRRDAPRIGRWLAANGGRPDRVLCSPAARTRATWELVAPWLAEPIPTTFRKALYLAEAEQLLAAVRAVPKVTRRLLLIGHNPGIAELAVDLIGSGDAAARAHLATKFPTAAAAIIDFETAFADIDLGSGRLVAFVTPKSIA